MNCILLSWFPINRDEPLRRSSDFEEIEIMKCTYWILIFNRSSWIYWSWDLHHWSLLGLLLIKIKKSLFGILFEELQKIAYLGYFDKTSKNELFWAHYTNINNWISSWRFLSEKELFLEIRKGPQNRLSDRFSIDSIK